MSLPNASRLGSQAAPGPSRLAPLSRGAQRRGNPGAANADSSPRNPALPRAADPDRHRAVTALAALLLLLATPAGAAEYWEGTYGCNQGETGLTLSLDPAPDGTATGLFHFYEAPANPGVPEGCFTTSGTLDKTTGAFDLRAGRWLMQPFFYVTVDLHGTLQDDGASLRGTVAGPGCTTFTLRRVARPLRPTAACYPSLVSGRDRALQQARWTPSPPALGMPPRPR